MNPETSSDYDSLVLSQSEVRAIDAAAIRDLGIPGLVLMENAARAVTDVLLNTAVESCLTILCGPGNNGGDGLAVARQLAACGRSARVILETAGKSLSADAAGNLQFLERCGIPVETASNRYRDSLQQLQASDWVVDSLLGTGVTGPLRNPFDTWVQAINSSPAQVLSIDVPSGMNANDGSYGNECVRATITVTFVAPKQGFLAPNAESLLGRVIPAHIGLPQEWILQWIRKQRDTPESQIQLPTK